MTTAADPHEEFEIAALRRAHGALDAEGIARLDAHLARCERCREFAASAAEACTSLRRRAADLAAEKNWDATRGHVRAAVRRDRLRIGVSVVLVCVFLARLAARGEIDGSPLSIGLVVFYASIPALAFALWYRPRRRRASQAEAQGAGEILRHCRVALDGEIACLRSRTTTLLVIIVLLAVVYLYRLQSALELDRDLPGHLHWGEHVFNLVIVVLVLAWVAWSRFVQLPRLERERREFRN